MSEDKTKKTGNYEIDGCNKGRVDKETGPEPIP
jgi:hypothetical protein